MPLTTPRPLATRQKPPKAERLTRSTKRLCTITLAWCGLLFALYLQGRAPKGILFPALAEFYYAFEAVFLPALVFLQWRLGTNVLARSTVDDGLGREALANALFVSASCFVIPDCVLLLLSRPDLLGLWARVAGPLALFAMTAVLYRATRSWRLATWTTLALALPALLFVR